MDRQDIINIIAGGPSVNYLRTDFIYEHGFTIGVNESSILNKCDLAISMDRLWMEGRYKQLIENQTPTLFRRCAWKLGHDWEHLELFDGDVKTEFMSDRKGILVGNNSGTVAINKAWQMNPKKVFLFGFDMQVVNKQRHYHKEYEWAKQKVSDGKYTHWLKRFKNIYRQFRDKDIEIFNVNPDSAIKEIPKINFDCYMQHVKG